jgi:hypothetical protein
MWTQLELFDEKTEEEFAMSLTNFQLYALRESNPKAHNWIRQVRDAVKEYESKCRILKIHLDHKLTTAKWGRTE